MHDEHDDDELWGTRWTRWEIKMNKKYESLVELRDLCVELILL